MFVFHAKGINEWVIVGCVLVSLIGGEVEIAHDVCNGKSWWPRDASQTVNQHTAVWLTHLVYSQHNITTCTHQRTSTQLFWLMHLVYSHHNITTCTHQRTSTQLFDSRTLSTHSTTSQPALISEPAHSCLTHAPCLLTAQHHNLHSAVNQHTAVWLMHLVYSHHNITTCTHHHHHTQPLCQPQLTMSHILWPMTHHICWPMTHWPIVCFAASLYSSPSCCKSTTQSARTGNVVPVHELVNNTDSRQ